ncbi:unnamed protein product [Calypogeia fissa]
MAAIQFFTTKFSPFGQRVHVALTEKKIPFELIHVDLPNKPEALLQANPIHKKVPTIVHNGKPIAESLVILEYLKEAFHDDTPLMPKDAYERSQVRFWADYIYKTFVFIGNSFRSRLGTPEKQAANEGILASLKTLESGMTSFSAEGPFFTGNKFGFLDVILSPFANAGVVLENVAGVVIPGPDELPRLHKWMEATRAYPSVSSVVPSGEESLAALKVVFQRNPAVTF